MAETALIMIIEDDEDLREMIGLAGERRSYHIVQAANGLAAQRAFKEGSVPDIIVLDINMPGMDGFSFCRWLRDEHPLIPVIFLSARTDEYDKILALEIGGDDYLVKPFSMKELYARISVSLRRVQMYSSVGSANDATRVVEGSGLRMDLDRWTCEYKGNAVILTVSEFRILYKLLSNPDVVVNRARLAEAAFPDDVLNSGRSIDIHVSRIRKKLQRIDPGFDPIETVYQVGYRWKS